MPRTLSAAALQSVFAQEGGAAVFLILLEIDGTGLPAPIRVVNNMANITHDGDTYLACAFSITLPAEQDEILQQVRLRIDNVDQQIVEGVRLLTGPPTITMKVILAATPDDVEAGPFTFTLRNAEYNALEVAGTLAYEDILSESYPKDEFTPAHYPGMFRDV